MESAVSFAPLRPADFVNFAGRGGARPAFRGAEQPVFPQGGAGRATISGKRGELPPPSHTPEKRESPLIRGVPSCAGCRVRFPRPHNSSSSELQKSHFETKTESQIESAPAVECKQCLCSVIKLRCMSVRCNQIGKEAQSLLCFDFV